MENQNQILEEEQNENQFEVDKNSMRRKLDMWMTKLLDMTKRNRMLNYKERKSSPPFVIETGTLDDIYSLLVGGKSFEYALDSGIGKRLSDEELANELQNRKRQRAKIEKIRKAENSNYSECGFHISYLVFGMLQWREETSASFLKTPVIMMPVEIINEGRNNPYEIRYRVDEDIHINPVIIKKLKDDFGIILEDISLENVSLALNKVEDKVKYHDREWQVEKTILLDNFNYQTFAIYNDLEKNREKFLTSPFVDLLVNGENESNKFLRESYNENISLKKIKSEDNLQILDADSSQQEAIVRARRGDSFVLQGPPGTGKSQTITNIIGEAIGRGKKVLFVSEKQAALNVVYDKLAAANLSDFVLSLHDISQNKKDIRDQIESVVYIDRRLRKVDQSHYGQLDESVRYLDKHSKILNQENSEGISIFKAQGVVSKLRNKKDLAFQIPENLLLLSQNSEEIHQLHGILKDLSRLYSDNTYHFKLNNWEYFKGEMTLSKPDELKEHYDSFQQVLSKLNDERREIHTELPNKIPNDYLSDYFDKIKAFWNSKPKKIEKTWFTVDIAAVQNRITLITDEEKSLLTLDSEIRECESKIANTKQAITSVFEEEFLNVSEIDSTLKILKIKYKSSFKRLFSSEYKDLLRQHKNLTKNLELDYEQLVFNYELLSQMRTTKSSLNHLYSKYKEIEEGVQKNKTELNQIVPKSSEYQFSELSSIFDWLTEIITFHKEHAYVSDEKFQQLVLGEVNKELLNTLVMNCSTIISEKNKVLSKIKQDFSIDTFNSDEEILNMLSNINYDNYREYRDYQRLKLQLESDFNLPDFVELLEIDSVKASDIEDIFDKRYYSLQLDLGKINDDFKEVKDLSSKILDEKVDRFKQLDIQLMELSRTRIYNYLVSQLPDLNGNIHRDEISILERELKKQQRFLPVRQLVEKLPNLLPYYKPCIMMSPLTVSTYFSTNDWEFDLVIFDEASQVKVEYAVASIARARQLIVAGDSKQMPPSAFFDSSSQNDDEELEEVAELESILDELETVLPTTHLKWHYRSKDESLITFSNKKFYNSRLLTFPSSTQDENVKFTFVPDGLWESRNGNTIEANKVVEQIIWYADNHPDKSIGVVAFGKSQATTIEQRLEDFKRIHPKYDKYFDENIDEPFFIKNLENVQGDERDIIILSVGYGKNASGKISMNFGPLTKAGGERRLNVAVSRAREIMHVISSMKGSDIQVDSAVNPNRQHFRDFLDYAEKGLGALVGYDAVDDSDSRSLEFDSDFEESVYNFLTDRGYKVHTQVGDSGYRIDLAIVHPTKPGRYILAIECDGAAYHSSRTARDRDRLRQQILESKGWSFYRIWSTNWLYEHLSESQKLLSAIENAIEYEEKSPQITPSFRERKPEQRKIREWYTGYSSSLPNYYDLDVYIFNSDLKSLSEIMLCVATKYIDDSTENWIRYVNERVFGRQRLTQGYKEVYSKALKCMENKGFISVRGFKLYDVHKVE